MPDNLLVSEQPYFPKPARMAASLPSVVRPALLRHIELSASSAELPDMPRPPLGRGGGNAKHWRRGFHHCGSRSGFPSYNLSVSLRSTAPLVGEPLAKRRGFPVCQGLPQRESLFQPQTCVNRPKTCANGRCSCGGRRVIMEVSKTPQ